MGRIYKGTVASLDETAARVVPFGADAKPTAKITIPRELRGMLEKGTVVIYVEFDDATGLILARADGESNQGAGPSIDEIVDAVIERLPAAEEAKF